jgi:hypothetical protein
MNFDNGGIRTLINHVPFNMHLSFATHPEAWTYYTSFFPHLRTPEDALFMNENCPAEASNLTNPSKLFQDLTGFNRAFNHTAREFFYFDHLSPDIQAKRLGASRRMFELGCHPSDDYTFLTLPSPTTPTTTPTRQTNTPTTPQFIPITTQPNQMITPPSHSHMTIPTMNPPNTTPNHTTPPENNTQYISPTNNNTPHSSNMSISTSMSPSLLEDDLASQTSSMIQLSITNQQPLTLTTTSHKRNRPSSSQSTAINSTEQPPCCYIQFNTPLQSKPTDILNKLATALNNASIPQDSISPTLSSWAFPSTKVTDEKVSFVTILDPSLATRIVIIIRMTFDLSLPTITDVLPHYPTTSDVDTLSEPTRNCRIKTCPFYNGGMHIFNDNPQGLLNAQNHGIHLHHDTLISLPEDLLENIGWTKCCLPCTHIYLSSDDLIHHRSECNTYSTYNTTNSPTSDPTTSSQWAPLFAMCPDSHKPDLADAISSTPDANPSSLFTIVYGWCMESKLPTKTPATTTTHHEP